MNKGELPSSPPLFIFRYGRGGFAAFAD